MVSLQARSPAGVSEAFRRCLHITVDTAVNICRQLIELGDSKFAVTVPGEPVVWIFSRRAPALSQNAMR